MEITRVLILDTKAILPVHSNNAVSCHRLCLDDLHTLAHENDFQISSSFVDDFYRFGFVGVAAMIDRHVVGLLFLVSDTVAARHNCGGSPFRGIGLDLPEGVHYLFKVEVAARSRGMHVSAAMLTYAVQQLEDSSPCFVVTTTDWTNRAFLKSVERLGFRCCGFASEFIVAGRHFYQLPKPIVAETVDASSDRSASSIDESRAIRFSAE
ncbi:MAG: hypothetical protein AB8B87_16420 [Granulosicoccus sp.]